MRGAGSITWLTLNTYIKEIELRELFYVIRRYLLKKSGDFIIKKSPFQTTEIFCKDKNRAFHNWLFHVQRFHSCSLAVGLSLSRLVAS